MPQQATQPTQQQYDPVSYPNGMVRFYDCQEMLCMGGRTEWTREPVYLSLSNISSAKPYEQHRWGKTNGHPETEPTPMLYFIQMKDGWRYRVQCSPSQFQNLIGG